MGGATSGSGAVERREWLVEGRVQGVAFRASARRRARELGVGGLAENLPDGRVRVVGVGEPDALDRLAEWLRRGPPAARVEAVIALEVSPDPEEGERIERFLTR